MLFIYTYSFLLAFLLYLWFLTPRALGSVFLCNPFFVYFSVFSGGLELLDLAGYAYDDVFYKVL